MAKLLQRGTNVAIFGDSHMEALGPLLERLLPDQLGVNVVRAEARRGWSTGAYLRSGDIPDLVRGADVVIVELGGNDAAAQVGPERHARDVRRVLEQVAPRKVIWVGPGVTLREDLERYRGPIRHAQKRVVEAANGSWIDSQPLTRAGDLRTDRIHFTMGGYRHWANALVPKLRNAGVGGIGGTMPTWWVGPAAVTGAGLLALGAFWWSRRS